MQTAFLLQHLAMKILTLLPFVLDNLQLLNNDNVQHLWHRGTSISYGLRTCFLETYVLICCMECKEWIKLTHWQREGQQFFVGEKTISFSIFVLFLTVMGLNPKRNTWLNQGMVDDSIKPSDWSQGGRGPTWSLNQNSKKKESSPPHLPLVGGRVKGSLVFRV